ncbi:MAG: CHAT domain-containing protein, partial [Acidobacteriota bacterium]
EEDLRDPLADGLAQAEHLQAALLDPIRDVLGKTRRVIIVPDGALHALNFETLPGSAGRYWIEDVEISVAPSLSVLNEAGGKTGPPSLLLIGAPLSAGDAYPALASAPVEIQGIQNRMGARRTEVRVGSAATPQAFLSAMPQNFSMIHFTAHAEANPESPLDSAVILSQESGGSKESGGFKLYARDIMGLKLSADLVTISACRSAGARSFAGEGMVGFAWAFLQSGAHSVIAGLWDVGDDSSAKLMDELYQGLMRGLKPAAALREAKLALLHSAGALKKPFYWAPYQTYIR